MAAGGGARNLSRLRWRCRRGMRELDTLLTGFLERQGATLGEEELARFEALLELQDPMIYGWLLGREQPEDPLMAVLVERIRGGRSA